MQSMRYSDTDCVLQPTASVVRVSMILWHGAASYYRVIETGTTSIKPHPFDLNNTKFHRQFLYENNPWTCFWFVIDISCSFGNCSSTFFHFLFLFILYLACAVFWFSFPVTSWISLFRVFYTFQHNSHRHRDYLISTQWQRSQVPPIIDQSRVNTHARECRQEWDKMW